MPDTPKIKRCPICNSTFEPNSNHQLLCGSEACYLARRRAKKAAWIADRPGYYSRVEKARYKRNRDWYQNYSKTIWEKARQKMLARTTLHRAVKQGKVQRRPCEVCSSDHSEAHHPDYSQPLNVVWLCRKHHVEIEKQAA